jgi:hypothetical protein
MEKIVSIVL